MDFITVRGERWLVQTARCCRDWPIIFGVAMGRCGFCGTRPSIVYSESESSK